MAYSKLAILIEENTLFVKKLYYGNCPLKKIEHGFFNVTKCAPNYGFGVSGLKKIHKVRKAVQRRTDLVKLAIKTFNMETLKNIWNCLIICSTHKCYLIALNRNVSLKKNIYCMQNVRMEGIPYLDRTNR